MAVPSGDLTAASLSRVRAADEGCAADFIPALPGRAKNAAQPYQAPCTTFTPGAAAVTFSANAFGSLPL